MVYISSMQAFFGDPASTVFWFDQAAQLHLSKRVPGLDRTLLSPNDTQDTTSNTSDRLTSWN